MANLLPLIMLSMTATRPVVGGACLIHKLRAA